MVFQNQWTDTDYVHHGVYGIYVDDELVYVGMTLKSFWSRCFQHNEHIEHQDEKGMVNMYYNLMRAQLEGKNVVMKPLFDVMRAEYNGRLIERRDLEAMEFGFIYALRPRFNQQGRTKPYTFSDFSSNSEYHLS